MKVACMLLLLVALVVPGFAQAPDDKLIVPGQRIGKWTLDMTIDDLLRMNGPRVPVQQEDEQLWAHLWGNLGLFAITIGRDSQSVVELGVHENRASEDLLEHKTERGIGIGSSREAVQRLYGPPTASIREGENVFLVYDQIGLMVGIWLNPFGPEGAFLVTVFRPGTPKRLYPPRG